MSLIVKTDSQSIFTITDTGDKKILQSHDRAIVFVGCTRVGKSTAFNWALKKPLIGKGNLTSTYVPVIAQDNDIAVVGSSFSSVTLAPNIYCDFEQGLSLVDMAGYQDTRDFVGVLGVSYFLKALFERARKVKFVIVFDEMKLKEQTCGGLIKTFLGFINMFQFTLMSDQIKTRLKNSMSVVITKSQAAEHYYEYFTQILKKMQDESFVFEQKQLIIELLTEMKDKNRIQGFKKARNNQQPEECTFIQRFNKIGWQFFDLDANEEEAKVWSKSDNKNFSLIALPFKKEFAKLNQTQQQLFINVLTNKIDNYLKYSDIIKKAIENLKDNWIQLLEEWKKGTFVPFTSFKMDKLIETVRDFVDSNDFYNTSKTVSVEFKVNYEQPSFIKAVNSIIELENVITNIKNIQDYFNGSFTDIMNKFSSYFGQMMNIIKIFATSQQEELLFERTNYILKRGFREFQKLYQLQDTLIHDIRIKLADSSSSVFEESTMPWNIQFRQKFIKDLDQNLLIKLFPNLQSLKTYEHFFNEYARLRREVAENVSDEEVKKNDIFFDQHRTLIQIAKADTLAVSGEREKALECFVNAAMNTIKISNSLHQSQTEDEVEKKRQLKIMQMKTIKIIKKIVTQLKLVDSPNKKQKIFALELSRHHSMIKETCSIYKLLIQAASIYEKAQIYQDYSKFCLEWGRIEEARIALQQRLALEEDSYESYEEIVSSLKDIESKKDHYFGLYNENLNKLGRLSPRDSNLDMLLSQILTDVQSLIRIKDSNRQMPKE